MPKIGWAEVEAMAIAKASPAAWAYPMPLAMIKKGSITGNAP